MRRRPFFGFGRLILGVALFCAWAAASAQPLQSWNEGPARAQILAFVQAVTDKASKDFVPPKIASRSSTTTARCGPSSRCTSSSLFMLDQVRAAAPKHPEWKNNAAFKALDGARSPRRSPRWGTSRYCSYWRRRIPVCPTAAYDQTIRDWLATARHPKFNRPYTDLVYVPMQELLSYLRANGFKTFIVSGGSIEFMRPWAEKAYGIPPEQIVGTISGNAGITRGQATC